MRRALYGSERLSALDLDSYLPDLIGPTEVLTDEYRKQLAKHLPARVEGECFYHFIIKFELRIDGVSELQYIQTRHACNNSKRKLSLTCVFIGYPWTLVFSTSQNGFSLNSLYRKMIGIDSPILLVIEDTQGNVSRA